jgi:signal transduction histidine kinase
LSAPVPPPREPSPGLDDVAELVERASGPQRQVSLTASGAPGRLSPGVALTAYRVVQESLTNTMRHTEPPTRSEVGIAWGDHGLEVEITDDGVPTSPSGGAGRGIRGMRDRVEQVGGRFESGPRSGGGWRTRAVLPLDAEDRHD